MASFRTIALAASLLAASGCVRESTTVKVNPDGSGTVVVEKFMKSWAAEEGKKHGMKATMLTDEEARARAGKMGEGVTFVSAEKLSLEGWVGLKATYSFKDVSRLRIDHSAKEGHQTSFRLSDQPGGRKLLTVVWQPRPRAKQKEEGSKMPEEVFKALMAGLKFQLTLEVAGTIEKTNSPHATEAAVTVFEADFDEVVAEEARLKKLASQEPKNLEEAQKIIQALRTLRVWSGEGNPGIEETRKSYQDIKGVKFPPPELTIEFSPR